MCPIPSTRPRKDSRETMRHRHRALSFYSALMCLPSCSFVVPLGSQLLPSLTWSNSFHDQLGHDRGTQRHNTAQMNSRKVASERPPEFQSNDAVSYYHNPGTSSKIWLVGTIHNAKASSKLVEKVIRRVKPQVVMIEMDAYRIGLLPRGEATKDDDGLRWWSALTEPVTKSHNYDEGTCEFDTAAREAVACGARVLLGDRDFEGKYDLARRSRAESMWIGSADPDAETKRRVFEAERADKEEAMGRSGDKPGEKTVLEPRIKRRGLEGTTPALWRKLRDLENSWKPRKFAVLVTERDEVMANNLLKLEASHGTVAVVGAHHTVGIGGILTANGWKTRRR